MIGRQSISRAIAPQGRARATTTGGRSRMRRWRPGSSCESRGTAAAWGWSTARRLTPRARQWHWPARAGGCSSMVEQKPSKLTTRVRFPSPAPDSASGGWPKPGAREQSERRRATAGWSAGASAKARRHADIERATVTASRPSRVDTPTAPPFGAPACTDGEVAEWLKAADCKSARASVRWFESSPLHHPSDQSVRARPGRSVGSPTDRRRDRRRSACRSGFPARRCHRR